jgi:hypothetical protein
MALVSDKRIPTTDYGSVTVLLCPRCGREYLHHASATMFDRPEDGGTAKRSFIDGTSAKVDLVPSENSGNPSSRRGGLCISFACEACKGIDDNVLELTISQHKGTTEIGWRYSPKSADTLV